MDRSVQDGQLGLGDLAHAANCGTGDRQAHAVQGSVLSALGARAGCARWSEAELALIREHYGTRQGLDVLLRALPERTKAAIQAMGHKLGVSGKSERWTAPTHRRFIRAFQRGGLEAAKREFPDLPGWKLRDRARYYGVFRLSQPTWSQAEQNLLIRAMASGGISAAYAALPGRSQRAIRQKAQRLELRGNHDGWRTWGADDLDVLKRAYPAGGWRGVHRLLPWRTRTAIIQAAIRYGVTKAVAI